MTDDPRFEIDPAQARRDEELREQMREEGKPGTVLSFATHWCPRHLGPYKADWPAGAAVAMTRLFQAFASDERVWKMAGYDPENPDSVADVERLHALALECSPLCCFVGDEVMAPIYRDTGVDPP